jgi:hypothetical protein
MNNCSYSPSIGNRTVVIDGVSHTYVVKPEVARQLDDLTARGHDVTYAEYENVKADLQLSGLARKVVAALVAPFATEAPPETGTHHRTFLDMNKCSY